MRRRGKKVYYMRNIKKLKIKPVLAALLAILLCLTGCKNPSGPRDESKESPEETGAFTESESGVPGTGDSSETETGDPEETGSEETDPSENPGFVRPSAPTAFTDTTFYYDYPEIGVTYTNAIREDLTRFFLPAAIWGTVVNRGAEAGALTAEIDLETTFQTVKGFGGSGCWWTNHLENYTEEQLDEMLILLYTADGIGLTTFRHNIGGGQSAETPDNKAATVCVEEFEGFMNIERDEGMKVIRKLQSLGIDEFTLFMNSPPLRLLKNGDSRGADDGSSNLPRENYEAYVKYCADIMELYALAGVPVRYLSPINEPQWEWGTTHNLQEGCHYEYQEVFDFDKMLIEEVEKRGLWTKVSVPESAAWYDKPYTVTLVNSMYMDPVFRGHVDHIAVHDYGGTSLDKKNARMQYMMNGVLWEVHMTEWANTDSKTWKPGPPTTIARSVVEDFTILNCTQYEWWTLLEDGGQLGKKDEATGLMTLTKNGYALGQFSKFMTGATRVKLSLTDEADEVYGMAFIKNGQVIVNLNNEAEEPRTVSLAGISGVGHVYTTDADYDLQYTGDVDAAYGITLLPGSVNTIVFE